MDASLRRRRHGAPFLCDSSGKPHGWPVARIRTHCDYRLESWNEKSPHIAAEAFLTNCTILDIFSYVSSTNVRLHEDLSRPTGSAARGQIGCKVAGPYPIRS